MFDIAYYETCARHVNLQVAKYYAGLLTMVGESKTIRCHFIHGKHVKYFLVSFSLAVVCLPHHNSSCVCFFIKFICIFWRAFGNMKLTLKGLLRLELSQNKSKVFKTLGKLSSQVYSLFCRIMSRQAFSRCLTVFSNKLLHKFIR